MTTAFATLLLGAGYQAIAQLREQIGFGADLEADYDPARLGNLPLVVLTRGRPPDPEALPPNLDPAIAARGEAVWQDLQSELATLSSRGVRLTAARSGHHIAADQPELVSAAIRGLVTGLQLNGSQR